MSEPSASPGGSPPPPQAADPVGAAISAALWAVGVGWIVLTLPPLTLLYRLFGSHRVDALTRLYTRGQVALTTARWEAIVDPAVDPGRPYVFVQNHVNVLDHVTMYASTPHFKQGIELEDHFKIPFYGWFMKARGTIPVNRSSRTDLARLMKRAREEIEAGRSLLAFPEGTRSRDGRVHPFHTGIFHIARALGVPVVPVAVTGMSDVLRTGEHRFRPFQRVTVHVLAPIETAGLTRADVDALAETCRQQISARVDAWIDRSTPGGAR